MLVPVYNTNGEQVGERELPDAIFGVEPNLDLMHQALMRQLANARLGTHKTKTRGEVSGGGRKPWRQKGTGRARQGSTRSPIWRHGGIVFGPRPRGYEQDMPKKMRRAALRSALSSKAREGLVSVVDSLRLEQPRAKEMAQILANLKVAGDALIAISEPDVNVQLASRNLAGIEVILASYLNVRDVLSHERLLLPVKSLELIEAWLAPEKRAAAEVRA
jgi:large subunit ribosomal protein L4